MKVELKCVILFTVDLYVLGSKVHVQFNMDSVGEHSELKTQNNTGCLMEWSMRLKIELVN